MLIAARIFLVITITSFVIGFGSCVACLSGRKSLDERYSYYDNQGKLHYDKGVSEAERQNILPMFLGLGGSFILLVVTVVLYGLADEGIKLDGQVK